jgi:hypothetical protein
VPVYASGVPATRAAPGEADHARMLDAAAGAVARGFGALKMAIGLDPDADVASVEAVRAHLGRGVEVYADAAGNYDVATALRVGRELERLGVGFFEAPLPHEQVEGYGEVARALAIPIANDVITNRYQVLRYLRVGGLDIVQPDVCRAGGLTELRRIAILADAFGVACTPHVSIGSAIHFVASFHAAAAMPNLVRHEYWMGQNPLGDALLTTPALDGEDAPGSGPRDGRGAGAGAGVPQGPGLGIEVDEARRAARWRDRPRPGGALAPSEVAALGRRDRCSRRAAPTSRSSTPTCSRRHRTGSSPPARSTPGARSWRCASPRAAPRLRGRPSSAPRWRSATSWRATSTPPPVRWKGGSRTTPRRAPRWPRRSSSCRA